MGSTMKPTIFDERVAKALHNWQQCAKKNIKKNRQAGSVIPSPSKPSYGESEVDSVHSSPKFANFNNVHFKANGSASFSLNHENLHDEVPEAPREQREAQEAHLGTGAEAPTFQHQIDIYSKEFSFNKSSGK